MNGRIFLNGWTQRPIIVSWVISQKRVFLMPENYVFGHLIEVKPLHAQVSPRCDQCPQLLIPNLASYIAKIFQSVFAIFLIADLIYLWRLTGLHIFRIGGTITNIVVEKFLSYLTYSWIELLVSTHEQPVQNCFLTMLQECLSLLWQSVAWCITKKLWYYKGNKKERPLQVFILLKHVMQQSYSQPGHSSLLFWSVVIYSLRITCEFFSTGKYPCLNLHFATGFL